MINRRNLLKTLIATTAVNALPALSQAKQTSPGWKNWSGNQSCSPKQKLAPATLEELQTIVRDTKGKLRVAGSGHSFSALVPTNDTLLSVRRLNGLVQTDPEKNTATFFGGTLLSEIGPVLEANHQALINMPDIDQQTLAGAIATSTHGTGKSFGSLSSYVTGLELITPSGDLLYCDKQSHPEIFKAAQVSLGSLGIISKVTMQNTSPFKLKRESAWLPFEEMIENAHRMADQNRNFEFFYIPFTNMCLTDRLNETDESTSFENEIDGNSGVQDLKLARDYLSWSNKLRELIIQGILKTIDPSTSVNASYLIYANERNVRFNEMEYNLPVDQGLNALTEIKHLVEKDFPEVFFPFECRFIHQDDIWLSPFYERDSISIAIHRYFEEDYTALFKAIEPIFQKYGGRPHWGKLNTLSGNELAALYPKWSEFQAVRETMDPNGKFLNPYLAKVFEAGRIA